ncbi:hypothetical protein ABT346_22680 [Micromonospora peucetia]|uniref:hypothetical protein n=1 Tax=Micromonospora peucetia TaxID=47871 RepID=UPI003316D681
MLLVPGPLTAMFGGAGCCSTCCQLVAGAGLLLTSRWSVREQQRQEPAGTHVEVKVAA